MSFTLLLTGVCTLPARACNVSIILKMPLRCHLTFFYVTSALWPLAHQMLKSFLKCLLDVIYLPLKWHLHQGATNWGSKLSAARTPRGSWRPSTTCSHFWLHDTELAASCILQFLWTTPVVHILILGMLHPWTMAWFTDEDGNFFPKDRPVNHLWTTNLVIWYLSDNLRMI